MTATELLDEFNESNRVQFNNMYHTQIGRVLTSMNFPTKKVKGIKKYAIDLVEESGKIIELKKIENNNFPFSSNNNSAVLSSKEMPF